MGRLRFGIFLPPYHNPRHSPSLAIERDLQLIEHLDSLGFDEAWFGEHHSGGYETIPSPELMIAAAAQRTKRIRLCTGVISLPYHHPLMVADRMVFLDHLTRGRVTIGFGPGALPADSYMMGMDYEVLRRRMEESIEAILALLDGEGPVDRETDWFTLREARLQVRSFSQPRVNIALASAVSPSGPRMAGKYGLGLISFGSASEVGFEMLASTWQIMQDRAAEFDQVVCRDDWALVGMLHIAETEEKAREEVRYGLRDFFDYHHVVVPAGLWALDEMIDHDEMVDRINASGSGVIGTPEMAVAHIERLVAQTGGFGAFLFFGNEWGNRQAVLNSYELFAREVAPCFDGSAGPRLASYDWTRARRTMMQERLEAGWTRAREDHAAGWAPTASRSSAPVSGM